MTSRTMGCAAVIAVVLAGCSSADGQSAPAQPGALRARSVAAGADLGYAYAVEPAWQFTAGGGFAVTVQMVLLKEQPAGAAPVLVWRALLSGSALECARYYPSADCTGAATIAPGQSGTVCTSGGRMYRPNFAAGPASFTAGSAEFPRWDPATLSFVLACQPAAVPPFMLNAVDAGPAAAAPGRIFIEAAD